MYACTFDIFTNLLIILFTH